MTTDAYSPGAPSTVNGIGPYPINFEYREGAVVVWVVLNDVPTVIDPTTYSITPDETDTSGNVYLDQVTAELYLGAKLFVERDTEIVQDWVGQGGNREKSLEAALDRSARGLQEMRDRTKRSLMLSPGNVGLAPIVASVEDRSGRVVAFDENGDPVVGPSTDQIKSAQVYAENARKISDDLGDLETALSDASNSAETSQISAENSATSELAAATSKAEAQNAQALAEAAADNAQSSARTASTWPALLSLTGASDGEGAEVLDTDAGTHSDAASGGYTGAAVKNAGRYSWNSAWSRWARIGDGQAANAAAAATVAFHERKVPFPFANQPYDRLLSFEGQVFARRDADGGDEPVAFTQIATFERDSAADVIVRDESAGTVVAGRVAYDYATGTRGALFLPEDTGAGREADEMFLDYAPTVGAAMVDFYYDPAQGNGQMRGLFSVDVGEAPTGFEGVCLCLRNDTDVPAIFLDDGTNVKSQALTSSVLSQGRHTIYVEWNLSTGSASYSLDGSDLETISATEWLGVVPAVTTVGGQNVIGASPREHNGLIYNFMLLTPLGEAPDAMQHWLGDKADETYVDDRDDMLGRMVNFDMLPTPFQNSDPKFLYSFEKGVFAKRGDDGLLFPEEINEIASFTRSTATTVQRRDGLGEGPILIPITELVPADEIAYSWTTGRRGAWIRPADGSDDADVLTVDYERSTGAALVDFHYDPSDNYDQNRGLFSICKGLTFAGVAAYISNSDVLQVIIRDENAKFVIYSVQASELTTGDHTLYVEWDLVSGTCGYSIDGSDFVSQNAVPDWEFVKPTVAYIGRQDNLGTAAREFNGVIYNVAFMDPVGAAPDAKNHKLIEKPDAADVLHLSEVSETADGGRVPRAPSGQSNLGVDWMASEVRIPNSTVIAGAVPSTVMDFSRNIYADADTSGVLRVTSFEDLITFTRNSTATYVDRDGVEQTAAANEPLFDYSEGGRGLLVLPADAEAGREADTATSAIGFQKGSALLEFYKPRSLINTGMNGLFSMTPLGAFAGVSVGARIDLDDATEMRAQFHLDDGASATYDGRVTLREGLNKVFVSWDLVAGVMCTSVNGSPIVERNVDGFSEVVPTLLKIGRQETIGGGDRELNGVICRVQVYDGQLVAPIVRGGLKEKAIRIATDIGARASRTPFQASAWGENICLPVIAEPSCVTVHDADGNHFTLRAKTGDFVADGDGDDLPYKVRAEMQRRVGFSPTETVYFSCDMMPDNLIYPDWGLLQQFHQGGPTTAYPGNPPLSLVVRSSGTVDLVHYNPEFVGSKDGIPTTLHAGIPFVAGQWTKIDMYIEFSDGAPSGVLKLWANDILVYHGTGLTLGYAGRADLISCKVGPYRGQTPSETSGAGESRACSYRNWRVENFAFDGARS